MDTVISAVNRTYPKADEKEIEFVFDYAKELETCMVMQDKRWLGEAFINVLDNAVKYSPGGVLCCFCGIAQAQPQRPKLVVG